MACATTQAMAFKRLGEDDVKESYTSFNKHHCSKSHAKTWIGYIVFAHAHELDAMNIVCYGVASVSP